MSSSSSNHRDEDSVNNNNTNNTNKSININDDDDNIVLCGKRGKAYRNHPGNLKFSQVVRESIDGYVKQPDRITKAIYVASVVSHLLLDLKLKFIDISPKDLF